MKRRLNRFVSILLTLIMAVGLVPFMSVPAAAKSNIPVVMSTANGDEVSWNSKVGSNDGYWEITAGRDDYGFVSICSGVTDHEAGTYEWSDLESTVCYITVDADEDTYYFTDGSCTVTVNGEVVNVSGVFKADNDEYYAVDITYGTASSKFVVTFSTDQPHVGLAVDTTATFACDSQGDGRLDHFIKIILGGNPTDSGVSANVAPTVTGGNGAVVAGLDNGYQYLTINERFDGNVTVSGKYYMGGEETDYSFTIACSDYVAVESVSLSPDTAQEINVDGTVAITPTVSPDGAYESVVEVTVGGTDSGAVALYFDADCNYSIQPIIPSGMPFYVKGVSAGTATVTITSPEDENITASIDITVNAPAATASFVKVTDASQIAVVNIGTCTAEDAKAWALANWDDLLEDSFFAEIAFYSNTGELYYVQVYNGLDEEYFSQYFDNLIATCSISDLQDCFADGDSVFICTPAAAPAVKYLDENGEEKTTLDYILINGTNYESFDFEGVTVGSLAEGNGFNAGDLTWIIIDGNVTFTNVINVSGTANVILKDGATLTASKGVYVPEGSTLNIYAQSTGDDKGVVVATGSSGCAGIGSGSNYGDACGTIVINGGSITATGGTNASGIGGSKGGTITVNGGYVEANGSYAPGIGVPADGVVGGTFTFNGGTVIANGGDEWSAGIGGYNECMGTGTIVIGEGLGLEVSADNSTWTDTTNDTTARARYMKVGVIEYPLWVGGVQVTSANAMDTTAHPTWGYSAYTHTLTLNGYTNSGTARADIQSGVNNAAIYYNDNMSNPNPLTIRLAEGTTNSLTMTGDRVYGIYVFGSALTITGNGTLNIQSDDMAINDAWGVAITGGTVNAASSGYYGINSVTIRSDISSVTVTGELGAVYGGSNEDQALINAVAGTGWTDTAGTTGEADIAISTTGQNVSSYKKVQFPAVEHVLPSGLWVGGTEVTDTVTSGDGWSYNASTNTLTLTDFYYDGDGFAYTNKNSAGIYYKGESPLNIVVEKTQYYSYIGGYENNFVGIYAEGGVVLTGEGRLNIYGNSGGIIGDVTVDGCELEVTCGEVDGKGSTAVTSLTVNSGKVTVDGGTVSGNGVVGGYAVETLTVNGGIVYAYGGDGYNSYEPTTQSAVKTLTVSGGVLYAKGGVSNWNSDLVPAVVTTADGGSITVGKDVKVYGADIRSSERHDMPNTLIEEEGGDFDRFFYMIFEGPSVSVTVPYKDHTWTDGALVTTDKEMTCNTMTFGVGTSWSGNYYVDHNVTLGTEEDPVNITLTGNTNIILSDTATLYVYGTIDCGDYTLNIYGNEMGDGGYSRVAFHSGAFTVNNTSEKALALKASKMNIHGGTVEVNSTGDYDDTMFVVEADEFSVYAGSFRVYVNGEKGLSALASASTNVYGGRFNVSGGQSSGENADGGVGFTGVLNVYGGYVNAYGGDAYGDGADGGIGITGNVEVYGGQVSTSGGYSSAADGGVAMLGGLCVYGGTFDADGGYANIAQKNNTAISATVTLGEGVGYFEGKTLFAEGPEEEMESGDANYAQIKGGAKYVYVDATTGAVTTAYTYEASNRIDYWLWSNWYIVEKDTTINDAVNFETNEVNIIIADGVTLTFANGLNVPEGKTLKIYAQSMDEATMGTLIATGANGSAGIGGENGGNVYIYSGNVEATGDTGAAGIDGIVYIYGGKVTATGGEGSVGINGDLTLGEGIMLYGDDDVNPPTTVIEEESGNYHRTRYMIAAKEAEEEPSVQTVTVTAHSLSKIYGFEDPEFTYTVEGLPAGVALTGSLTRTEGEDVGTYAITIGTLSAGDKYTLIFKCGALEITARNVDVKADAASKTYGDADPELTYTVEGLVGNDALTGALARTEGETAGTYEITQGTLSAGNNYVINFTGSTLTIGKKTVTVKADAVTKTYGDTDPELTYTIEGLVGTDALTGTLERAEGENAGTYRITQGTLEAGGNYEISFTGSALTIEKKTVTVKADAKNKAYGDEDPELTYTVEGLVGNDALTGSLERSEGEDAGTYDITIGTLSAGDNYEINFTGSTLTINSAEIKTVKVSANAVTKTYGEKDPELTYTAEGLAEGDTLTGTLERAEGENVGIYAITLGTLTAGDKYTIEFTGSTLTIEKKTVKVTANNVTKTYGENDPELTYTVEGLVGNDALTGSLERVSGEDAGNYDITIGTLSAGDNYVLDFTGATLTINTTEIKTVKVTANAVTKTYGEKDPELTYTAEGLADGDTLTGTLERAEGENVGIYAITLGTLTAGDNYTIEFVGSTLTIEKKTVTVTADAKTKTGGENDPELTYTVEGLVGNDALTGSLERVSGEDAGTYDITIGTLSAGDNYVINFTGATLTINASEIKTVKVTANEVTKTYGDKDPELTYTAEGLAEGDTLTGSLERAAGEDAGTYEITLGTLTAGDKYTIEFTGSTLTIEKKAVAVKADAKTKTYGDRDPEFTYTVEGLVGGDTLTGLLARAEGENVGTYEITLGTLSASDNYTLTFTGSTLTVEKKAVTVKADAKTKTYGGADPDLTYAVEGLVGSDTLTGSLARAEGENVGTYEITLGTLSASDNYTLTFTGAELTVKAKRISVMADEQKKAVGTSDPELTYIVEGLVGNDKLTGSLAREAGEDEGTYAITLGTLSAGDNYVINFTGSDFTIYENRVETDVNVGEGAPEMKIENIDGESASSLLTEEEKEALDNGEEVKIYLEVIAVDEEIVPEEDKTEIEKEAKKSGMTVGIYLDMSLLKQVGRNDAVAIHDTEGNMVKVTVTVPEELRNTNPNIKRTFYVVRVHEGKTDVLGESTGDTVSFETDKFSTYSLTYRDSDGTEAGSLTWLWIVIAIAAAAAVCAVWFFFIKKKEKTTK